MSNYNLKSPCMSTSILLLHSEISEMCLRATEQLLLANPTAVKRILTEAKELREPTDLFHAQPLEVCDDSRLLRCSEVSLPYPYS
jgi:hypothetical protein